MGEILINISAAAIITAVFKLLAPEESGGRQIKLLLSCFFIAAVMGSIEKNAPLIDFEGILTTDTSYNDYSCILERQTADEAANALRERIKTELKKENIEPEKIYIDINISEHSSISFNEIRLVFNDASSEAAERAVIITEKCVGNEIKVSIEEG